MSSETPQDPGKSGAAQPFARGRIQWGRPPQPIFQVGPLPRAAGGVANIASPPGRTGAGILRGSMVPPAAPVEPPPPPEAEVAPEPVADTVASPEPKPEPEPEPVTAPAEIVAEVEEAEPAVTVPPPLSGEAAPVAEPRRLPSVVVTPAIYAGVSAAIQKVTGKDRWVIVAAVVAVLVTGGFIWLATLPAGGAGGVDQTAPTPVATPTLDPAPLPVEAEVATVARPAAPTAQPPETRPPEPRPVEPIRSAPRPAAPAVAAPPVATPSVGPRPYIETAPLIVPTPTPAAPPPSDPDAPIATQPQPLN